MNQMNSQCSEQENNLMSTVGIRVRNVCLKDKNQYALQIETYNSSNGQTIQKVIRTLHQIDGLSNYIVKQYGGFIIPVINSSRQLLKNQQTILHHIQLYLEDLRLNDHSCADPKFYCFLFQQAMSFPRQQTYSKVLNNASTLSKKYLNTIFTRKQLPQEKDALNLVTIQQKLQQKISHFSQIKSIISSIIMEGRAIQQIKGLLSQMSRTVSKGAPLEQNKILIIQKILHASNRYIVQAREAYSRWQICVEGVRELHSNLLKGLHQDVERFEQKNSQLKNWTKTLCQQLVSMSSYFDSIIDYLSHFISNIKYEIISSELSFAVDTPQTQQIQLSNINNYQMENTLENQKCLKQQIDNQNFQTQLGIEQNKKANQTQKF